MKVGYATGVFDLFHIGHLNVLKKAKEHCDFLIVGVCTDELVQTLKSKQTVVPYSERAEIVSAIKFVDKVVPEVTTDKVEAWKTLKFDVTFKGDDWKGTEKWNKLEQEFAKHGVSVVYFPYTQHTSSTLLASALRKL
jgi:glycerol-3-phosphate cytidylyltransferase